MPPWQTKEEALEKGKAIFYCDRHDHGLDWTHLGRCYRERLLPPTITAQGPLSKTTAFWTWIKSLSPVYSPEGGIQDLPIIPLKTALYLDGPFPGHPEDEVPLHQVEKYSLLIVAVPRSGFVAFSVRRCQLGPFGDRYHNAVMESGQYAIAEIVLQGPQRRTVEEAVRALNIDLEVKLRLKSAGAIDEVHRFIDAVQYRGEVVVQRLGNVDIYEESLHGEDNLYCIWSGEYVGTGRRGAYACLGDGWGTWQGKRVIGPWVLLSFELWEEGEVEVLMRDPRHCEQCHWCIHGLT